MLDVNDLVEGVTKVRVLSQPVFVEQPVGSVGTFIKCEKGFHPNIGVSFGKDQVGHVAGKLYWFFEEHLEIVADKNESVKTQSEDLITYKSRWDEIINNLEGGYGMTEEEVEVVKSVLKNNVPYSVIDDPKVFDPIIEKEDQTHLDATYIGGTHNVALYYKSEVLKKWFCWSEYDVWLECEFAYENCDNLFPITISKQG